MRLAAISNSRRDWLAMCLAAVPCAPPPDNRLSYRDLPPPAVAVARELGLTENTWAEVFATQQHNIRLRIAEGSAEHITYYVLQSRSFTGRPPIDPVRLAASRPSAMPSEVQSRFAEFLKTPEANGQRHQVIRKLWEQLADQWPPERCFRHTMAFLSDRRDSDRDSLDALYQRRGLATDTIPAQTAVLERAFASIGNRSSAPMLLIGPGLDLTRRENFQDSLPLRSYQADWLSSRGLVECMDVRPEVVEFLRSQGSCAFEGDVSRTVAGHLRYSAAFATNVFLYLSDQLLFLAFANIAAALQPGGWFVHNDGRFAAKVFGEVLGLPVVSFAPLSLGFRGDVEQMDRVVLHQKTLAIDHSR